MSFSCVSPMASSANAPFRVVFFVAVFFCFKFPEEGGGKKVLFKTLGDRVLSPSAWRVGFPTHQEQGGRERGRPAWRDNKSIRSSRENETCALGGKERTGLAPFLRSMCDLWGGEKMRRKGLKQKSGRAEGGLLFFSLSLAPSLLLASAIGSGQEG